MPRPPLNRNFRQFKGPLPRRIGCRNASHFPCLGAEVRVKGDARAISLSPFDAV